MLCGICFIFDLARDVYSASGSTGVSDLGPKRSQNGPKWDKSGAFSDQISVHFRSENQNAMKSYLKKPRICPIWGQFASLQLLSVMQIFCHKFDKLPVTCCGCKIEVLLIYYSSFMMIACTWLYMVIL